MKREASTKKPKAKVHPAPKLKRVVKHTAVKRSAKKSNASARSCPGSDHQGVVEHIESLGFERFKFRKKVLAALTANGEETQLGEPGEDLSSIVPDVFKIDPDKKIIYVVEVENSKGVFSKLRNYEVLWFYLDCEEWDLVLSTISKTDIEIFRAIRSLPTTIVPFGYPGNVVEDDERKLTLIGHPIDLCTLYCQGLYEDRGKLKDQGSASLVPSDRRVPSPTLERITE